MWSVTTIALLVAYLLLRNENAHLSQEVKNRAIENDYLTDKVLQLENQLHGKIGDRLRQSVPD
jgi:FtsZ-binding cell division protein ZapB